MSMEITTARFEATRALIGLAGETGCGKTLSALLLARGLAGPNGKVGMIDTENKRSRIYAGDADVGGFDVIDLAPPFTPERYLQALDAFEKAGVAAVVVDSMSHEWSGIGGCIEQAEAIEARTGKSGLHCWNKPKASHRRFVNRLTQSTMHVICCMRAGKKVKPGKDDQGKAIVIESADMVPETEKRFPFELTLFAMLDQHTHLPRWTKLPRPLMGQIRDGVLIGNGTGKAIADWLAGGVAIDKGREALAARIREAAGEGAASLRAAWETLTAEQRKTLGQALLAECKGIASEADRTAAEAAGASVDEPDADNPFAGTPAEGQAAAPTAPATGATIAPGAAAALDAHGATAPVRQGAGSPTGDSSRAPAPAPIDWCPSLPTSKADASYKAGEIVKRLTPCSAEDRMAWFRVEKHAALHAAITAQLGPEHDKVKAVAKLWQEAA